MKSFLSSLLRVDGHWPALGNRQAVAQRQPKHHAIDRALQSLTTSILIAGALVGSVEGFSTQSATAAPTRKDWCGIVWSLESNPFAAPFQLAWVNPTNGASSFTAPNPNITMPSPGLPSSGSDGAAALGIHKESGTMFAMNRDGNGQLYKYRFGVDTTWQPVTTDLPGIGSNPSVNLNKMTVDGNFLYLTDLTGSPLYSLPLNPTTGAVLSSTATKTAYTYAGIPTGSPKLGGGDITTDEYGDTYNITYDTPTAGSNTTLYFFKQNQSTAVPSWDYQGKATSDDAGQFGGAAFYKGDLYVKSSTGKFKKVDLTRAGTGYTGWSNLSAPGAGNGTTDLTACGTPNVTINKTQEIYLDSAATTLSPDQTKVKTGQYLKYFITAKNTGDAWARSANIADNLPIGTNYVANSAALNGTNLGVATYPTAGFPINSPGLPTGTIPFAPDPDTATLSFVAQVSAVGGSVQNRATIVYIDPTNLVSEPPVCTTQLNCGESPNLVVDNSIPKAQLLLVKRITAIKDGATGTTTAYNSFVDDTTSSTATNDNHCNWPNTTYAAGTCTNTYTVGATTETALKVKPGDEIEYTIYYLNIGKNKATARVCDRLNPNLTFQPNFDATAANVGKGIGLQAGTATIAYLTNIGTDADKGQLTTAAVTNCNLPSNGGTEVVAVDVGNATTPLLGSTGTATTGSYGYVRFKAVVK